MESFPKNMAASVKNRLSWLNQPIHHMTDLQPLYDAILKGDAKTAKSVTEQAVKDGMEPLKLIQDHMMPAMGEVGRRFECNEYFVPELLLSARAMKAALELLRPLLAKGGAQSAGRVVVGTVKGDLHDIGKNLLAAMLEGGGFEVTDIGVNVSPEQFVSAVKQKQPQVLALSALLTTTMSAMKDTIEALKRAGIRDQVKILVGGAPVTKKFADEIGADGYAENAAAAPALVRQLLA
jgi:5-methyltetrahydrofolate--homocysteine methyltransferase